MATQWFLLQNAAEYENAFQRFQQIKHAEKGSDAHKEKMLLATLLEKYEAAHSNFPDLDPIELIKIRMEDFNYKPIDLATAYGDKGTVSKVLNYKQPLSLKMIRAFSELLRIPPQALLKEYELTN